MQTATSVGGNTPGCITLAVQQAGVSDNRSKKKSWTKIITFLVILLVVVVLGQQEDVAVCISLAQIVGGHCEVRLITSILLLWKAEIEESVPDLNAVEYKTMFE